MRIDQQICPLEQKPEKELTMSKQIFGECAGEHHKIEVITGPAGWLVTEDGVLRGSFDNIENAYQEALSICTTLFDAGVVARVFQSNSTGL